jgi:hypothetical protein
MAQVTVPAEHILRVLSQVIEVNDVASVAVTDPVLDQDTGHWVRDIQVFRKPDEGATNETLILTLRLKGAEKADIFMHAPGQDF